MKMKHQEIYESMGLDIAQYGLYLKGLDDILKTYSKEYNLQLYVLTNEISSCEELYDGKTFIKTLDLHEHFTAYTLTIAIERYIKDN